jgi:16S rRNA G527 N7-methylase RsmG
MPVFLARGTDVPTSQDPAESSIRRLIGWERFARIGFRLDSVAASKLVAFAVWLLTSSESRLSALDRTESRVVQHIEDAGAVLEALGDKARRGNWLDIGSGSGLPGLAVAIVLGSRYPEGAERGIRNDARDAPGEWVTTQACREYSACGHDHHPASRVYLLDRAGRRVLTMARTAVRLGVPVCVLEGEARESGLHIRRAWKVECPAGPAVARLRPLNSWPEKYEVVTARAVAPLNETLKLVSAQMEARGIGVIFVGPRALERAGGLGEVSRLASRLMLRVELFRPAVFDSRGSLLLLARDEPVADGDIE